MSVNLYIFTNPRSRRRTTHNGLSTRDSIVDNRISAKRGKNVAALIFETLRNHAAHPTACGLRRLQSSIAHVRNPTTIKLLRGDLQRPQRLLAFMPTMPLFGLLIVTIRRASPATSKARKPSPHILMTSVDAK
jgi:hypothetical protein